MIKMMNQNNQSPLSLIQCGVTKSQSCVGVSGYLRQKDAEEVTAYRVDRSSCDGPCASQRDKGAKTPSEQKKSVSTKRKTKQSCRKKLRCQGREKQIPENLFHSGSSTKSVHASLQQNSL